MRTRRPVVIAVLGVLAALPGGGAVASAQDAPTSLPAASVEATALPAAPDAEADAAAAQREAALGGAPFVSVVPARGAPASADSLPERVAESAGVRIQSLGGLGQFSSVSIRGAAPSDVAVYVDGVPLTRDATATVDLSSLGLDTLERVEVYRGVPPATLGEGGLGGAINLVTRIPRGDHVEASAGAGSFGYRKLDLLRSWSDGPDAVEVGALYAGATGDFRYYDDNGTPQNPADDRWQTRGNDDYQALDLVAHATHDDGDTRLEATARSRMADQGIPGVASEPAAHVRLATARDIAQLHAERRDLAGGTLDASATAWALGEWQHYDDPLAEVSMVRTDQTYASQAIGAQAQLAWAATARQLVTLAPDGRAEQFASVSRLPSLDPAAGAPTAGGTRVALGAGARDEILLQGGDLLLAPELRADWADTRPPAAPSLATAVPAAGSHLFIEPRAGVRWLATPDLAVKASVGRTLRLPTFYELYGERGYLVGNPALLPETGLAADAGVSYVASRPVGPLASLALEAAVFAEQVSNVFVLAEAGREVETRNLGAAHLLGAEGSAQASTGHLDVRIAYTRLDARQVGGPYDGLALPQRPTDELTARLAVRGHVPGATASVAADVSYAAGTYRDAQNADLLPPRLFLGASFDLRPDAWPHLSVALEVKNLTNALVEYVPEYGAARGGPLVPRAVSDFVGYPLPGRAAYLVVDYHN